MKFSVNPNRMELLRLKRRLIFAYRGHKLLKDKQEELTRHFLKLIEETKKLREEVQKRYSKIEEMFIECQMTFTPEIVGYAISLPEIKFSFETYRLMNLTLPKFNVDVKKPEIVPYIPLGLNFVIQQICEIFPLLVKLSEKEKSVELVAYELQRTRRRVNALEYILIPSLKETIRFISARLNELERSNITRLMKIKELRV
jgi:V/A-type H+-transporting ATPase subunit D